MIEPYITQRFETLQRANENRDLGLIEVQRVSDDKVVVVLAAFEGGEITTIVPLAEMIAGNPFDLYRSPDPDAPGKFMPTDNETKPTLATPANMTAYERKSGGNLRPAVALDRATGEVFAASAGDYFALGENEALTADDGTPLVLVTEHPETTYRDALTDVVIP